MNKYTKIFSIWVTLIFNNFTASANEIFATENSLKIKLNQLTKKEMIDGRLYCENSTGGKFEKYHNCKTFLKLKEKDCFATSTRGISLEQNYSKLCKELNVIGKAIPAKTNHFELGKNDWWKKIPAAIIPTPGGIYNDEEWEYAKEARDELVKGKLLGEINFSKLFATETTFEAVLSASEGECGLIEDSIKISIDIVADFDGDGIADLLLKGYRVNRSPTCNLGSGNSLGASFSIVVTKTNKTSMPELTNL